MCSMHNNTVTRYLPSIEGELIDCSAAVILEVTLCTFRHLCAFPLVLQSLCRPVDLKQELQVPRKFYFTIYVCGSPE